MRVGERRNNQRLPSPGDLLAQVDHQASSTMNMYRTPRTGAATAARLDWQLASTIQLYMKPRKIAVPTAARELTRPPSFARRSGYKDEVFNARSAALRRAVDAPSPTRRRKDADHVALANQSARERRRSTTDADAETDRDRCVRLADGSSSVPAIRQMSAEPDTGEGTVGQRIAEKRHTIADDERAHGAQTKQRRASPGCRVL